MTTTETKPNGSTDVTRWQPGAEMFPWNTRLGHLIDAMWHNGWRVGEFPPNGDLEERDDMFVLEIDLPGVDKKNVTVNVADRRVSVHGTRVERERDGVLRHSTRVTGTFSYELALPTSVDEAQVSATLKDGVLTVTLPKARDARSTHVPVN